VDFLKDESGTAPGEQIATDAMNTQVKRLISRLRPIEADILRKRFGLVDDEELTLKEIGSQYSLSRERIRQLQEQALGKTIDKLLARAEQEEFDQSSKERLDALLLERQSLRRQREEAGK
jgi:RNA polymerase primary sigma factor